MTPYMSRVGVMSATFRARAWLARSCLIAGFAFAAAQPVLGIETPASPDGDFADCRLTVFARQALQHDLLLANHNLGVTVHDRKATLWGAVHSAELSRRAEDAVRKVPGIALVKNDLRVERPTQSGGDLLVQTWSPAKSDSPLAVKRSSPDNLTSFTGWMPPTNLTPPVVSLGAPVVREPINPIAPPVPAGLEQQVKKLRDSDARFRNLRLDVEGAVVRLRGSVDRWEDAFELASAASRIAGVERIIMDEVATKRPESLQLP